MIRRGEQQQGIGDPDVDIAHWESPNWEQQRRGESNNEGRGGRDGRPSPKMVRLLTLTYIHHTNYPCPPPFPAISTRRGDHPSTQTRKMCQDRHILRVWLPTTPHPANANLRLTFYLTFPFHCDTMRDPSSRQLPTQTHKTCSSGHVLGVWLPTTPLPR